MAWVHVHAMLDIWTLNLAPIVCCVVVSVLFLYIAVVYVYLGAYAS